MPAVGHTRLCGILGPGVGRTDPHTSIGSRVCKGEILRRTVGDTPPGHVVSKVAVRTLVDAQSGSVLGVGSFCAEQDAPSSVRIAEVVNS